MVSLTFLVANSLGNYFTWLLNSMVTRQSEAHLRFTPCNCFGKVKMLNIPSDRREHLVIIETWFS